MCAAVLCADARPGLVPAVLTSGPGAAASAPTPSAPRERLLRPLVRLSPGARGPAAARDLIAFSSVLRQTDSVLAHLSTQPPLPELAAQSDAAPVPLQQPLPPLSLHAALAVLSASALHRWTDVERIEVGLAAGVSLAALGGAGGALPLAPAAARAAIVASVCHALGSVATPLPEVWSGADAGAVSTAAMATASAPASRFVRFPSASLQARGGLVPFLLVRIDGEIWDGEDKGEGAHTSVAAGESANVGAVSLVVVVLVAAFACPPPMRAQHVAALRNAIDRASLALGAKDGEDAPGVGSRVGACEGVSARVAVLPRAYASHLLPLVPAPTDGCDARARTLAREHERAHTPPLRVRPFAEQQAAEEGSSSSDPCAPLAFCGGVRVAPRYLRALLRQHAWGGSVEVKPDYRGGAASATLAVCAALCGLRLRGSEGDAPFSLVAASVGVVGDAPSLAAQFARAVHCAVGVPGAEEPISARAFARVDDAAGGVAAAFAGGGPAVAGASAQPAAPRGAGYLLLQQQQVTVWPAVGQSPASLRIFWRVESCAARGEGRAANDASVTGSSCESADREAVDAAVGAL
jgi:hypothetical protein